MSWRLAARIGARPRRKGAHRQGRGRGGGACAALTVPAGCGRRNTRRRQGTRRPGLRRRWRCCRRRRRRRARGGTARRGRRTAAGRGAASAPAGAQRGTVLLCVCVVVLFFARGIERACAMEGPEGVRLCTVVWEERGAQVQDNAQRRERSRSGAPRRCQNVPRDTQTRTGGDAHRRPGVRPPLGALGHLEDMQSRGGCTRCGERVLKGEGRDRGARGSTPHPLQKKRPTPHLPTFALAVLLSLPRCCLHNTPSPPSLFFARLVHEQIEV